LFDQSDFLSEDWSADSAFSAREIHPECCCDWGFWLSGFWDLLAGLSARYPGHALVGDHFSIDHETLSAKNVQK
jgi:hypothetical protein